MAVATKPPKPPATKTVKPVKPAMDSGLKPGPAYSKSDVNLILGLLRPPPANSFNGAATAEVQAQTAPVIKQITDSITGATKAGQDAIAGYTGSYMDRIKGLGDTVKQTYDSAKESQGAANASIGHYLEGEGAAAGDDVMAKLKAINAGPGAEQLAGDNTRGTARIAGGASTATGVSVLDRLVEQGASGETAARNLPAIGALAGEQTGREFGLQQGKSLSDQVGAVTAGVPAMVAQAMKDLRSEDSSRRQQAASLIQSLIQSGHSDELQKAIARQGYNTQVAGDSNDANKFNASEINALTRSITGNTSGGSGSGINPNETQNAVQQAAADAYAAATALFQPTPTQIGTSPDGRPIYRSKGGGRTFDGSQAQTTKQAPTFAAAYKQVFNRILPELAALDPTNARRLADQITRQQLAAAGIAPPAKKG